MKVTVYPVAGRLVRDPTTLAPLPVEGAEVDWGVHWARRESDGDVTRTLPAAPTDPSPAPAAAADPTPAAPKGASSKKAR